MVEPWINLQLTGKISLKLNFQLKFVFTIEYTTVNLSVFDKGSSRYRFGILDFMLK